MKKKKMYKLAIALIITIIIGASSVYVINRKENKNEEQTELAENINKEETTKALTVNPDSWDTNKVTAVTSEDNIVVPVPVGFIASTDENERYVNGREVEKNISSTSLTFAANTSDAKPWTLNGDNVWVSGNKGVNSSTSELLSNEFTIGAEGGYVSIVWSVSSEAGYDKVSLTAVNTATSQSTALANISGTGYGTTYANLKYETYEGRLETGTYTLSIKYTKDGSGNSGLDSGYIKSGAVKNLDEEGDESITVRDKSGGFVIYEGTEEITNLWTASKERNQFVWVPVENTSRIYEENSTSKKKKAKIYNFTATGITAQSNDTNSDLRREPGILNYKSGNTYGEIDGLKVFNKDTYSKGLQGYTKDSLYKELETEYKNTIKSIEKYGGFYIGRYETGAISTNTPVVKRMNTDIASQSWYNMYTRMKNISTNPNIQTSMIWGSLFDETLQWLIDTEDKTKAEIATDSTSWGNYSNSTFQYYNNNGELTNTKSTGRTRIPTGSTERNKANNIYDLAGNVWDWTLEGYGSNSRFYRGGYYSDYGNYYPAQYRSNGNPYCSDFDVGFRSYFYIK